jgi:hypothetical protein
MCISIDKIKPRYFYFSHEQYDKEVAIMKKNIEKLNRKIELSKKILK